MSDGLLLFSLMINAQSLMDTFYDHCMSNDNLRIA